VIEPMTKPDVMTTRIRIRAATAWTGDALVVRRHGHGMARPTRSSIG
jgi:hypothetical protein